MGWMLLAQLSTLWVLSLVLVSVMMLALLVEFAPLWVILPLLVVYALTVWPARFLAATTSVRGVRRPHLLARLLAAFVVVMLALFFLAAYAHHQELAAF